MRKIVTATASAVAIAGGMLFGAPAANAQLVDDVAVQVPVNVCGNQVNVIAVPVLNSVTGVCNAEAEADQDDNFIVGNLIGGGKHHGGKY